MRSVRSLNFSRLFQSQRWSLSGDNQYQRDNRETNDKLNSLYT